MDHQELIDRLGKLLWTTQAVSGMKPGQIRGRSVPESWGYHTETVKEAIKQLKEMPNGSNDSSHR